MINYTQGLAKKERKNNTIRITNIVKALKLITSKKHVNRSMWLEKNNRIINFVYIVIR